jgi:hypothetical protein
MAERPWCNEPFTDVRARSVGDGFSVEARSLTLNLMCVYISMFIFSMTEVCSLMQVIKRCKDANIETVYDNSDGDKDMVTDEDK